MAQTWAVLAAFLLLLINLVEGTAYDVVSVEAGHEAVLSCPYVSKVSLLMVIWKRKCSTCCLLAYRSDRNETRKLNCSERMTWKYSPDSDPALRIYPVSLGDEGNYTCEIINSAGNFLFFSFLTVIVPPTVTLTFNKSTGAVCQASAGKPAADIFWLPPSNHSTSEEVHHPNGTVTRLSWANSKLSTVTCLVTHPATNQSLSLDLPGNSPRLDFFLLGGFASVAVVSGVALCLFCSCRGKSFDDPETYYNSFADYVQTKNFRSTPSWLKTEAVKPPVLSESIYQNYSSRMVYMNC
ncbi:PREDICTED: cell surface glycoprotein CD200 receptor 1-B-like [Nestor notabilis]|uniref:cell surface glycoprotein CD200 receptor 1-B-like n=1 Tax=Nestor notabilis TaxID=176057 RepID=UPI000523823F|nr:PREDICTED: cell surface glycoprotein CD200 receptor 1-B-like [Nestor notabilis]